MLEALPPVPVRYVLVENSNLVHEGTVLHLLSAGEVALLRCWMALLLLPASTRDLVPDHSPFAAALSRLDHLPSFRKAQTKSDPPPAVWDALVASPLVILLAGSSAPAWLQGVARERHIGLLSFSSRLVQSLRTAPNVHAGLLKGMDDLRESYRVIGELLGAAAEDNRYDSTTRSTCAAFNGTNILANRPRLDFIPPFPLPHPNEGRPAAYLLNRLSNNVDEPSLLAKRDGRGLTFFPAFLNWCMHACGALALQEIGREHPETLTISQHELEEYRARLTGCDETPEQKFQTLLALGRQLTAKKPIERPFFAVPAPRLDLIQGKAPTSMVPRADNKKLARVRVRAVTDALSHQECKSFSTDEEKRAYLQAQETLIVEQRLVSCQSAWLASKCAALPIQLEPLPGRLYNALRDLGQALEHNSRKIPDIFRSVELLLSRFLPAGLLNHLAGDSAPVTFFSDLPLEWTLLDEWPVCLTRPVSRIPMGLSHWDVLNAALEYSVSIDPSKPEKVLVLDLIEGRDPVRSHSDAFMTASADNALNYTYSSPKNSDEFKDLLGSLSPDIVVLDSHGSYDRAKDELSINLKGEWSSLDDLVPFSRVPPVWVLSACHTSVTGAIRGCFVRNLLARGAVCVIATLNRVDAFTASMFVGRLLTDIYSPVRPGLYRTLAEAFFVTQYTTALLYDPLLPLLRRAEEDQQVKKALGSVLLEFFARTAGRALDVRTYKYEIAWMLGELLQRHGLQPLQTALTEAGLVRPETLLFTAFGVPDRVSLGS